MARSTVFEVAAEAGVSVATVDRVLNRRGGVRSATIERVTTAIDRLGYRRDAFAAGLATRRSERYAFVLPSGSNSFMAGLRAGVVSLAERLADQRVEIALIEYAAFDADGLRACLREIDVETCHGVAVVGIDTAVIARELDRLCAAGLGVVTVVSDVTPSRRQGFVGIDNKAAGRVAGALLGRMVPRAPGRIAMVVGRMTLHDHVERRLGCEQVLRQDYAHLSLLPVIEGNDDSACTQPLVTRLLRENPEIVGLYSAGAGNRGILAALRETGATPVVVAHELTEHARAALLDGMFTVILDQDRDQEVAQAIAALRGFATGRIATRIAPVRLQVFLRENLP